MLGFGALTQFALTDVGSGSGKPVFSSFSTIPPKRVLSAAVIATTFVGFVAPPPVQITRTFTSFSQPVVKRAQQNSWLQTPSFLPQIYPQFTAFSQPFPSKAPIADEQPSPLFEVEPPQSPPFVGFLQFSQPIKARVAAAFETTWNANPIYFPPDTHDIVFVDDRKRINKRKDLIEEELARKAKLRADIELAIYGPDIPFEVPEVKYETPKAIDLGNLPVQVAMAKMREYENHRRAAEAQEEDDLENLLKDIL